MATLLLPAAPPRDETPTRVGTATLILVRSPIRAADGTLHVLRQEIAAGQTIAACLPARPAWARVLWNGGVLPREAWDTWQVQPGDEVWAIPQMGIVAGLVPLLAYAAVGIAVSIAVTALTYVLFPPDKPHMSQPEERTFSFTGIQTAIGPGGVVPIIYGRHRVGGQLLSAYVEESMVVMNAPGAPPLLAAAVTQPPSLTMLLGLSEGPIVQVITATLELNGQPWNNQAPNAMTTLDARLGTPYQTPIPWANETRNTFGDGRALPDNSANTGQVIIYTTTQPVQAFILNLTFQEGLFHITGKGEKEVNIVTVTYAYAVSGTGVFSPASVFDIQSDHAAPVRLGLRQEGLAPAIYDIAVNYGNPRHNDELHDKWLPSLESVTEIQNGTQSYPNTALLALRMVATEAMQGSLPNVTVEVQGRTVRVGTFAPVETWSDNPAWCVMDFLTSQRYGLGIDDSEIDLFSFATTAAYDDEIFQGETRHTFNYVLDREGRAQALLLEMLGGSRTLLAKAGGTWIARPTRNDPPVQLLSWATCSNFKATYTRDPDRINVMEARFANEAATPSFTQDVITWPAADQWPAEMRKSSMDLRGVTKPSRVTRAMQFELNRRQFENVVIEFDNMLDATTLLIHDIFRFAHPLPGWGESGRVVEGSTAAQVHLDTPVTLFTGFTYHLYLRFPDDTTEARQVVNVGDITLDILNVGVPFSQTPVPRDTLWAFGLASPDTAVRLFRVVEMQRRNDLTVHIKAVVHNPSIYDEPVATPLPIPPGLFNPLGPPPPLTFLRAMELVRIQSSGASLHVVNLAWAVDLLQPGFAPYGGAIIYRRTVPSNAVAGLAQGGTVDLGIIQDPNDANTLYTQLTQVRGHTFEFDDYTVVDGSTYVYRVVPVSGRDVPNIQGAREALLHLAGPTTQEYFPGTILNLRLRGKAVGDLIWEGRDVHIQWDAVAPSPLFSTTFFIQDYVVQVWAPGQEYLLRATTTTALEYTYTFEQNLEDQIKTGHPAARRDLMFIVWARTNTNRISLNPASITVTNPPPDMSDIIPDTTSLFEAAIIAWNQWAEPRDFDHYELHLDTMNPPIAIYTDMAVAFHGQGTSFRKVFPQGLIAGQTYYTYVLPYDTFGVGIASQTATLRPVALTADKLDDIPPGPPTNLVLAQGSDVSSDGTIQPWVEATWTPPPDPDVAGYEVHVLIDPSTTPTIYNPAATQHTIRFNVPGHVTVRVRLLAFDAFHNLSPFTADATITTAGDTVPPGLTAGLTAIGSIKSVALLWTPPPDLDYDYARVWSSATNDLATASIVGTGKHSFVHDGLGANDTRYYWLQAVDTSGNLGGFAPASPTTGVPGTAGQLDTTYISSLAVDKLLAGTLHVFVSLGVGSGPGDASAIYLDGVNRNIVVIDNAGTVRVILGKLGPLSTDYGLFLLNALGQFMWNFSTGAQTPGITDAAITAAKIAAAVIDATHLRTDTAVITTAAQIANAIIGDAKITNLAVEKVLSGTMASFWQMIGATGAIFLDGVNRTIWMRDENNTTRVWIGKYGSLPQQWSLILWDQFGNVQFDPVNGILGPGLANAVVSTPKIVANAVTSSLAAASASVSFPAPAETVLVSVTFPTLAAGDTLWLTGKSTFFSVNFTADICNLVLREDSGSGTLLDLSEAHIDPQLASAHIPMSVATTYNVASPLVNKTFVLTAQAAGTTTGGTPNQQMHSIHLIVLRLQR